jgi:hypothetical protein
MLAKAITHLIALALLSGCAGEAAAPRVTADHPAHPEAAASPLPAPSETLALGSTATVPASSEASHHDGAKHVDRNDEEGPAANHDHHGQGAQRVTNASPTTRPAEGAEVYTCPHHREVTSDKAGETCPKCRMKLVRKETKAAPEAGDGGHP